MAHTCSLSTAMGAFAAATAAAPFLFFFALPDVFFPFFGFPIADSSITRESRKAASLIAHCLPYAGSWPKDCLVTTIYNALD